VATHVRRRCECALQVVASEAQRLQGRAHARTCIGAHLHTCWAAAACCLQRRTLHRDAHADRVFGILRERNPELTGERRRTVLKPPQVMRARGVCAVCAVCAAHACCARRVAVVRAQVGVPLRARARARARRGRSRGCLCLSDERRQAARPAAAPHRKQASARVSRARVCVSRAWPGGARGHQEDGLHQLHGPVQGAPARARAGARRPRGRTASARVSACPPAFVRVCLRVLVCVCGGGVLWAAWTQQHTQHQLLASPVVESLVPRPSPCPPAPQTHTHTRTCTHVRTQRVPRPCRP
jgi:hypothetical protein